MPLAHEYYRLDTLVSREVRREKEGDAHRVYYGAKAIATVRGVGGHLCCSCGQGRGIGTPCPHILCVAPVPPEERAHAMRSTALFSGAFEASEAPPLPRTLRVARHLQGNQALTISRGRRLKEIPDAVAAEILRLLDRCELQE